MENKKRNWVITGGTGFIGRELLHHLLSSTTDNITLLCRNSVEVSKKRVSQILAEIDPALPTDWSRMQILAADFESDRLGISASGFEQLSKYDNQFIHLAASTRFTDTLEKARLVNVRGMQNAFGLATALYENGSLTRFAYVSTAYVQGCRNDTVCVDDPLTPSQARNTYEQSKGEAELWVRQKRLQLPITIFRPSIVVGNSRTGRSSGTATIYWAVKMLLSGHKRFFARPDARLDMVPVDYVVSAMLHLLGNEESIGKCYPLVAGTEQDQTLSRLAEAVTTELSVPKPVMYSPTLLIRYSRAIRYIAALAGKTKFADQMLAYLPYFSENPRFDNEPTRLALAGSGIQVPEFDDYAGLILRSFANRQGSETPSARLATA